LLLILLLLLLLLFLLLSCEVFKVTSAAIHFLLDDFLTFVNVTVADLVLTLENFFLSLTGLKN
jgi:hypothetical protein